MGIEPTTSALHLVYHDNISTALYQLSYESSGALKGLMPQLGIEPRTYRLQSGCSTTELSRQVHLVGIEPTIFR